jgi:DNA segregation ATPase FtsK/SpoIIIE-like protein
MNRYNTQESQSNQLDEVENKRKIYKDRLIKIGREINEAIEKFESQCEVTEPNNYILPSKQYNGNSEKQIKQPASSKEVRNQQKTSSHKKNDTSDQNKAEKSARTIQRKWREHILKAELKKRSSISLFPQGLKFKFESGVKSSFKAVIKSEWEKSDDENEMQTQLHKIQKVVIQSKLKEVQNKELNNESNLIAFPIPNNILSKV